MSKEKNDLKQWKKPVVKEITLAFDKDVVAKCYTVSGGNAAVSDTYGCQMDQNTKCN